MAWLYRVTCSCSSSTSVFDYLRVALDPTMQAPSPPADIVHCGIFQLDLKARELHKAGVKVKLQDQPFRVLALLVDRAGQVVTREELRQKVWPTDVYVDFDHGLPAFANACQGSLVRFGVFSGRGSPLRSLGVSGRFYGFAFCFRLGI